MVTTAEREGVIVSAQIPIDVREELVRRAEAADRSLSAQIRRALSEHIEREEDST